MNINNSNRHAVCLAVIFVVTLVLYWNSLSGDFIWDDRGLILDNSSYLDDWKNLGSGFYTPFFGDTPYYRPLLTGSLIIDYQLWGTNPFGYHFTNLILHIVNAVFVYLFMLFLLKQAKLALLTSLLFTAHPVQSEAVAWISGRNDLMLTFFALISFILHLRWRHFQGWRKACAYSCFLLAYLGALLTKESGTVLPLLLLLVDYFYRDSRRNIYRDYAGIVLITAVYYVAKTMVIGDMGVTLRGGEWTPVLNEAMETYAYYFRLLFFPVSQSAAPVITITDSVNLLDGISSFSLLAVLVALALISLNRFKELSFAIIWVMISLIPVCGIVPLSMPALEHRLYLATVGFSMLFPCAVYRFLSHQSHSTGMRVARVVVSLVLPAVLILYSDKTVARNAVWDNELTFWRTTVEDSPDSAVARNGLGIVYARAGNHQTAIREFKKALALPGKENLIKRRVDDVQRGKVLNNLGQSYYQLLRKRIRAEADSSTAVAEHGTHADEREQYTERLFTISLTCYQRALRINPESDEVHNNLGDLFYIMKNYPGAEEEYRKAMTISPDRAEYYNNLGLTYYRMRNYGGAVEKLRMAIALQPDFLEARNNLALVYLHLGMYAKALDELERVLSCSADNAGTYFNLALVYLRGFNDSARAVFYLKEGLKLTSHRTPDELVDAAMKGFERDRTLEN